MSLCGVGATEEQFNANLISYSDFVMEPSIVFNPKLLVRVDGRILTWKQAAPILASLVVFKKNLSKVCPDNVKLILFLFFKVGG